MDSIVEINQQDDFPIDSPWGIAGRDLALCLVSMTSKCFLSLLNSTRIINRETMQREVMARPEEVGLLTVCNHTRSACDGGTAAADSC